MDLSLDLRDLQRLVALGEGLTIEFKRRVPRPARIAKEVIALANAQGGKLLLGVDDDGTIVPELGPFEAGRTVVLRAEMDLMLVVANCPHVMDPRDEWTVTPLRVTAWRGPVTPEDDPIRNDTPEGLRAFLNVEDYYRR